MSDFANHKTDDQKIAELAEVFERLGARHPEMWARSEILENIPQLARFLFLRTAWLNIPREDDTTWIDRKIKAAKSRPDSPGAGVGLSLQRVLKHNVDPDDITEIVRGMQFDLLFLICHMFGDSYKNIPDSPGISWNLMETLDDKPTGRTINALYESVLHTDPSGREMMPREPRKARSFLSKLWTRLMGNRSRV